MRWRLIKVRSGWIIEYKKGFFSGWNTVKNHRKFSFEPIQTHVFRNRKEANKQMNKLIIKNNR